MTRKREAALSVPKRPAPPVHHPPSDSHIPRTTACRALRDALDASLTVDGSAPVVLLGPAGAGKTMLARELCAAPALDGRYVDGIFWLHMGPQPHDLSQQLQAVGATLGDADASAYATLESALQRLTALLTDRSTLLVFDDVWDLHQALALRSLFDVTASLVLTRDAHLTEALPATVVACPPFSPREALRIVTDRAGTSDPSYPQIVSRLEGNPLALTIAGALLRKGMRPKDWLFTFDTLADAQPASDVQEILKLVCAVNLSFLPEERRMLFHALAVFQPRVAVPEHVIHRLWRVIDRSLSRYDHGVSLDELESFALVERRRGAPGISVHDVLIEQARDALGSALPHLHSRLLDSYNPNEAPWHTLEDDGYLYRFLCYHLNGAAQDDTLRQVLMDYDWIEAALARTDMGTVQDAYGLVHEDKTLRLVQEALWLSARTLACDPSQLAHQLICRLSDLDVMAIERFLAQARRRGRRGGFWLEPRKVSLTTPGSGLLDTFLGHVEAARALAVAHDGLHVFSGAEDGTIKRWDLQRGAMEHTYYGHEAGVQAVALCHDRPLLYSGSDDGTIRIWEIDSGACLHVLHHHEGRILALTTLPGGRGVLSAGEDGRIHCWDAHDGTLLRSIDTGGRQIWSMCATPDAAYLVAASDSQHILIWDLATGTIARTLVGHTDWVWGVAITADGDRIVSASEDRTVIVWSFHSGRIEHLLKGHQGAVRAVAVAMDGAIAVSASEDQSIKVWDLATGTVERTFSGHDEWVWAAAITPDGRLALSASDDGSLKKWSLSAQDRHPDRPSHGKSVRAIRISPDYLHVASVSDDQSLRIWRLSDGHLLGTLSGHRDWVWEVAFAPDGKSAATASFDHTVRLWDVLAGQPVLVLEGHTDWVWCVAIAPDGNTVVSGSEDGTVRVWSMVDGGCRFVLEGHRGGVSCLAISQDSRTLVSGSVDGTVRTWSLEDGRRVHTLAGSGAGIRSIVVSDISQRIFAGCDDGSIQIWSLLAGTSEQQLAGHDAPVTHLAALSVGFQLVSAGADRRVVLWDLVAGDIEHVFDEHRQEIRGLAVSPEGRFVVTASDDHAALLWDLEARKRVAAFYADHPLTSCQLSMDGSVIVLGDAGGGVHLLEIEAYSR